jgi:hypothetical protein
MHVVVFMSIVMFFFLRKETQRAAVGFPAASHVCVCVCVYTHPLLYEVLLIS